MNKMYLVLGDWSKDGHNQSDKVLLESNLTVEEVQKAYKKACKLTNIAFDDDTKSEFKIVCDYEDNKISKESAEILRKHIDLDTFVEIYDDEYYLDSESFVKLWIEFIKIAEPAAKFKLIDDTIPNINGYWDKNLNVQFGYGLYF